MDLAAPPTHLQPHARSFLDCLREFLTPEVWKQVHRGRKAKKKSPALVLPLLRIH